MQADADGVIAVIHTAYLSGAPGVLRDDWRYNVTVELPGYHCGVAGVGGSKAEAVDKLDATPFGPAASAVIETIAPVIESWRWPVEKIEVVHTIDGRRDIRPVREGV